MKKFSVPFALLGIALLCYSSSLAPYKNEKAFMAQYMAMHAGQSAEYFQLRAQQLTPKYQLQDHGIQALMAAGFLWWATWRGQWRVHAIGSRAAAIGLAIGLPILTVSAYVFDLFQGSDRGEFPRWADSLGIPLMGVPVLLLMLLFWSVANMALLSHGFRPNVRIGLAFCWRRNWWLMFNAAIWFAMVLLTAVQGQYWYAAPAVLWVYFYVSIAATRVRPSA